MPHFTVALPPRGVWSWFIPRGIVSRTGLFDGRSVTSLPSPISISGHQGVASLLRVELRGPCLGSASQVRKLLRGRDSRVTFLTNDRSAFILLFHCMIVLADNRAGNIGSVRRLATMKKGFHLLSIDAEKVTISFPWVNPRVSPIQSTGTLQNTPTLGRWEGYPRKNTPVSYKNFGKIGRSEWLARFIYPTLCFPCPFRNTSATCKSHWTPVEFLPEKHGTAYPSHPRLFQITEGW